MKYMYSKSPDEKKDRFGKRIPTKLIREVNVGFTGR